MIGPWVTFAPMARWAVRLFFLYFMAVWAAPAVVFVHFQVRRTHIEQELCVQRDVMEDMRTCHGECVLSKRFKALEQEAEKGFPAERIVRFEPVVQEIEEERTYVLPVLNVEWSEIVVALSDGFADKADHVPWA